MKIGLLAGLILSLFAISSSAQTITQNLVNQTVTAPQTATFTVAVSGGPCRSVWHINGIEHYGAVASIISYSIASTSTDYHTGTTVQVSLYSCTGGSAGLVSSKVTLTVNGLPPTATIKLSITNDDGTIPAISLKVNQVVNNPDGTTTNILVLTLVTNATGTADVSFVYDKTQNYDFVFTVNGVAMPNQFVPGSLFTLVYPTFSSASVTVILYHGTATIKSSTVVIQ